MASKSQSPNPWEALKRLDLEHRRLRANMQYQQAKAVSQQQSELVELNRERFPDAEDRIRRYKGQEVMDSYLSQAPELSLEEKAGMLRQAAALSTPSACVGLSCASLDPQLCLLRKAEGKTSWKQQKMCATKLGEISKALNIEASAAIKGSENPDYSLALKKRRQAVSVNEAAVSLDPYAGRVAHQRYLEYYHSIAEGQAELHNGNFANAKKWFQKALDLGKNLSGNCFPNFFRNVKEIQEHLTFIDAVDLVSQGKFDDACTLFDRWLTRFPELADENDMRYDTIRVYHMACKTLDELRKGTSQQINWNSRFAFVRWTNLYQPAFVLLKRLRGVCDRAPVGVSAATAEEIGLFSQNWILFVPDSALLARDKTAGVEQRPVNIPSFLNVFDRLEPDEDGNWKKVLIQNLKNLFLIMADYESKRYSLPPSEERDMAPLSFAVVPSEAMDIKQLAESILQYLRRRDRKFAIRFEDSLRLLESFGLAINRDHFGKAKEAQRTMFELITSWPHTIRVLEQAEVANLFPPGGSSHVKVRQTVARRLGDGTPRRITFTGPQDLRDGEYYYLRPKWNTKFEKSFRNRDQQFHHSEIPKLCDAFFVNMFGICKTNPSRFRDWVLQFEDSERLLACKLFEMLEFYCEDDIKEMWLRLYREKLPPEAKTRNVRYFGLGHTAKSGHRSLYTFLKSLSQLERNERSFINTEAFGEIGAVDRKEVELPAAVVFVDDFVGKGVQAIKQLDDSFEKHRWLGEVQVYYCCLVGFRKGINEIKKALQSKRANVFVLKELEEIDEAFSENNPAWESQDARLRAKRWAGEIGCQVLSGDRNYVPERDKLGWQDSQALISFSYNVPNNTLPLFWGTGKRNGKAWKPLVDRHD